MFWVGLATLIMLINGTGDDSREFRRRVRAMHEATEQLVPDASRRAAAERALNETQLAFFHHRERLEKVSACIADADADYVATSAQYSACLNQLDEVWATSLTDFLHAEQHFRAAVHAQELVRIHLKVRKQ